MTFEFSLIYGMFNNRIQKELKQLNNEHLPGIAISLNGQTLGANNDINFNVVIDGPEDTPYENGKFELVIDIPKNYPIVPPILTFKTTIFHPNIDNDGRICLDLLKPAPSGNWTPASNISQLLLSIRLLMSYPNANDGLSPSATELYKKNIFEFNKKAREMTLEHASKHREIKETIIQPEISDSMKRKYEELTEKKVQHSIPSNVDEAEEPTLKQYKNENVKTSQSSNISDIVSSNDDTSHENVLKTLCGSNANTDDSESEHESGSDSDRDITSNDLPYKARSVITLGKHGKICQ